MSSALLLVAGCVTVTAGFFWIPVTYHLCKGRPPALIIDTGIFFTMVLIGAGIALGLWAAQLAMAGQ